MADYDVLISKLDLAAKVRLLTGASAFTLAPEPEIGLAELRMSDGPTGVRGLKFSGGRTVALLPNATLLASSWSDDVMREVGEILAEEALAQQIHVVLGPTINLHRSPLGGRLFEAYSEDPLLTGKLAAAYVRGLQGLAVGACLKHLVANESETERSYPTDLPAPDSEVRREQLTRLAAQGMTVVRNESDTLPLSRGTKVALIGRHAVDTIGMGGGSAHVNPPYQVSVAEGLRELLGDAVTVTDGVEVRE